MPETRSPPGGSARRGRPSRDRLNPFVSEDLAGCTAIHIPFRTTRGILAKGYEATLLANICEAVLAARDAKVLIKQQEHIAIQCDILMRGFARVGIIALIDEVTGYQEDRELRELHAILAKYISKELLPWTQRFPYEFYEHVFRLRGWRFNALNRMQGPRAIAQITTKLIYDQLPPGVLAELCAKNPTQDNGRRRFKLHQFLTADIGNIHLEKQVASVTTLLRIAERWEEFLTLFHRAFPQPVTVDVVTMHEE